MWNRPILSADLLSSFSCSFSCFRSCTILVAVRRAIHFEWRQNIPKKCLQGKWNVIQSWQSTAWVSKWSLMFFALVPLMLISSSSTSTSSLVYFSDLGISLSNERLWAVVFHVGIQSLYERYWVENRYFWWLSGRNISTIRVTMGDEADKCTWRVCLAIQCHYWC